MNHPRASRDASPPSIAPRPGTDAHSDVERRESGGSGDRLIEAIQALSLARDLETVMDIVRHAARELAGADGATFVLRDGDLCYYAEEDAIAPLWRGMRFPMSACISGWAMLHRESVVIPDIYSDPRVPADAYRPTFVQSLAIVPIRRESPIGAIGTYWATAHTATDAEVRLLQALADSTSIAIENVELYQDLERRVAERTTALAAANSELEAFSYSVSHDLRAPLRAMRGFAEIIREDHAGTLPPDVEERLDRIIAAGGHMFELIEALLRLSRISRGEMVRVPFDLAEVAREIALHLDQSHPSRKVEWAIADSIPVMGDRGMLRSVMENLLTNAWKFTREVPVVRIEVGGEPRDGETRVRVADNGIGFTQADDLFKPFKRQHRQEDYPGLGIGLHTVKRIVEKHGGTIAAERTEDGTTVFSFRLP